MNKKPIMPVLIMLLPVGLILGGIVSFIFYFHKQDQPSREAEEQKERNAMRQQILRKDPQEKDIKTYIRLLTAIGERNDQNIENLYRAASAIENILGDFNMGYAVKTLEIPDSAPVIWAEVEGETNETVLIATRYDSNINSPGADQNASGVASTLSLANAFVGTKPTKTLVFGFYPNVQSITPHIESISTREISAIELYALGSFSEEENSQTIPPELSQDTFPTKGNFLALISDFNSFAFLEKCSENLKKQNEIPIENLSLEQDSSLLSNTILAELSYHNIQTVLVTSTGKLRNVNSGSSHDTGDSINSMIILKITAEMQKILESL